MYFIIEAIINFFFETQQIVHVHVKTYFCDFESDCDKKEINHN